MANSASTTQSNLTFLGGGGEMGGRIRELDWSKTPLGAVDAWPQSLRSTLSMLLPSKAQIVLFWGPEFTVLYNDAYRPVFGAKHPHALGLPGREAWSEIWDGILHELLAGVVRTGEAFWAKDMLFLLERYGFVEETYFDVSYDPVRVESGDVGGVFCIVTETTERVVGARRMALLKDLAAHNATARTARDACILAMDTLAAKPADVTFALAYLDDVLECSTPGAEERLAETAPDLIHELVLQASSPERRGDRLVVGLNPRRPFDESYRAFLGLVANQLGTALTNAREYEHERARAEGLAEIDRAKTAFFSNVSHEFRTPLTLILGPVQDALAVPDRALSGEALATVGRNTVRLLKLVNTLLDFARIEDGRAQATFEPTELSTFTTDLAGAFRSAVESAGLRFDVDCAALPELVAIDRAMWEQIVFNLLSNALKFTFEGYIRLSLAREGDQIRLTVADTGVGIAPEDLPHVFERFHRATQVRARTYEGTGIGLALVHELVRLHGGSIAVDSAVNQGTTFSVLLPMRVEPAEDASRAPIASAFQAEAYVSEAMGWLESGTAAVPAHDPDEKQAQILLADDNADMRVYVERLLGERWRVHAVPDGAAALSAARRQLPDVIVADVMMPEMDGFELLAALRHDPATRDVPVILLSARAGEEATHRGLAAGADDYLVKPFTARDLLTRVDAQLTRARARAAARARMAEIESLVNNAPLGVYFIDQDFRIAHVNPIAKLVFGDIPDLVGRDLNDVVHRLWTREHADEIIRLFRHTLETGEPHVTPERAEFRVDRGITEYYESRLDRIQLPDQRHGVVCYFRDISATIRARDALQTSEALLREADRRKDEFLAMLAHELRNPLAPITTGLELIRVAGDTPGAVERVRSMMDRQVGHMVRLVDDLLDVSRITSGKIQLRREPTPLSSVVNSAVEANRAAISAKQIALSVSLPEQLCVVDVDPTRFVQVVSNLLHNATKFTEPGGSIRVGADIDRRDDEVPLRLSVVDSGIGISPELLPNVFELFTQGERGSAEPGLGIGLALARRLVQMHGGRIDARSDGAGRGSEFVIHLPLVSVDWVPQHRDRSRVALAPRRVVVIDDNRDAADATAMLVEALGGECRVAYDGESGIREVLKDPPDIVLLDIGMPGLDGYETARRIRSQIGHDVTLVALTGFGQEQDKERVAHAGIDAHLTKPADAAKLATVFSKKSAADSPVI